MTPYLPDDKYNSCKLLFLLPRHPNQKSMLHEFKLKIAQSKHPWLKALHQEASLSSRDAQLRADLKTALKFRLLSVGKNIQTELENGLDSFKQIHEKTLEDKISASCLYRPLSGYYLPKKPEQWLSHVEDHLSLINDIAKDDNTDWRWQLVLSWSELQSANDAYASPLLKNHALNLLKAALHNMMDLQTSQPGPLQNKVLNYQKHASQIILELANSNEFPSQLTKILVEILGDEADQNLEDISDYENLCSRDLTVILEEKNIIPRKFVERLIQLSAETDADVAVKEPGEKSNNPEESEKNLVPTNLRSKL